MTRVLRQLVFFATLLALLGCAGKRLSCDYWYQVVSVSSATVAELTYQLTITIDKGKIERDLGATVLVTLNDKNVVVTVVRDGVRIAQVQDENVTLVQADGPLISWTRVPVHLDDMSEWNGFIATYHGKRVHLCQY